MAQVALPLALVHGRAVLAPRLAPRAVPQPALELSRVVEDLTLLLARGRGRGRRRGRGRGIRVGVGAGAG